MKNSKLKFFLLLSVLGLGSANVSTASVWSYVIPTLLCPPLGIGMLIGQKNAKPYASQHFIDDVCAELDFSQKFNNELNIIAKFNSSNKKAVIIDDLAGSLSLNKGNLKIYISNLQKNVNKLKSFQNQIKRQPCMKQNSYNKIVVETLEDLVYQIDERLPKLELLLRVVKANKGLIAQ